MMYRNARRAPARPEPVKSLKRKDPLSDTRYEDLLSKAGAFFAAAERDVEAERAAALVEIRQTMEIYGLTAEDLR